MIAREYSVKFRRYHCHPETCGHDEHFPWWIIKDGYWFWKGFDTEEEAITYLEGLPNDGY